MTVSCVHGWALNSNERKSSGATVVGIINKAHVCLIYCLEGH